jgi:DmsE family decaheme c-type cytochrome
MNTLGPVAQLPVGAASGRTSGLRVFLLVLLGAALAGVTVLAAPAKAAAGSEEPSKGAAHAEYVGAETCASCHEEVSKGFASNPHSKISLMHGNTNGACESCHGPGSEHVAGGGDVSKIFVPSKATAKEVDEKCLSCHAAAHPNFARSPHAKADVGCTSCHSVHASKEEKLLKAAQPGLCFQCHGETRPQFSMPFHHKVNEGAVTCNDCHDVHGSFANSNLKSTADQNAVCTKCHMDKRGPFIFEHAAVKGEGCLSCHTPHGSQNARLLNVPSVNVLCAQCHSMVATNTVHNNVVLSQSSDVTPCIDCHTMVHGSNLDPFLKR